MIEVSDDLLREVDRKVIEILAEARSINEHLARLNGSVASHERELRLLDHRLVEHAAARGHPGLAEDVNGLGRKVELVSGSVDGVKLRMALWAGMGTIIGTLFVVFLLPLLAGVLGGS